jgi:hypothetical protein
VSFVRFSCATNCWSLDEQNNKFPVNPDYTSVSNKITTILSRFSTEFLNPKCNLFGVVLIYGLLRKGTLAELYNKKKIVKVI